MYLYSIYMYMYIDIICSVKSTDWISQTEAESSRGPEAEVRGSRDSRCVVHFEVEWIEDVWTCIENPQKMNRKSNLDWRNHRIYSIMD